jgi:hypothetical protein
MSQVIEGMLDGAVMPDGDLVFVVYSALKLLKKFELGLSLLARAVGTSLPLTILVARRIQALIRPQQ